MRKGLIRLLSSILWIVLPAYGGSIEKIIPSPTDLKAIKTIAIIKPPETKSYIVMNFVHPGMSFGLVGGIAMAIDQQKQSDHLNNLFNDQGLTVCTKLAELILTNLTNQGYIARIEEGPWQQGDGKYAYTFAWDKVESDADAVLVVSPSIVGFIVANKKSGFIPTITAVVTLLGKDRKNILYRGYHSSGWNPKEGLWKHTNASVTFSDIDAIFNDPNTGTKSLQESAANIAATIAVDLQR